MNVLAVDIGGTHLKFRSQTHSEPVKVKSGSKMTPQKMMSAIQEYAADWNFDHVSLGYPGPVVHDTPLMEPHNLGKGWVQFKFKEAFDGKPLRMLNDAAMQALGSYKGGRMLFLGLGTGLGSAMVVDNTVQSMELAHFVWKKGKTYEDFLGAHGLKRDGRNRWLKHVTEVVTEMQVRLKSDYIVLGGGNAKLVEDLPKNVILGENDNAFKGAFMLWKKEHASSR